jgi:integrase
LFKKFMELHSKPMKKSWKWDELNYRNHLSELGRRSLKEVTPDVISRMHKRVGIESGHGQANRTLALVKSMFNFGIQQRYFEGVNPCYGIKMFKEKSRARFLDADEMHRFLEALSSEPNQDVQDFFLLALFTGARRGNVQAMKWANLDLEAGVWTIPGDESKNSEDMKVILTPESVEILRRRKQKILSLYVFPSNSATGHLVEPKRAWKSLLKRAGIVGLWIHDLRRTLGSWQAAKGAGLPVIGKSLGHKNQATTAIYARLNLDPVRASVNAAVAEMLKQKD